MNNLITIFFLAIRIISNPIANAFQKKLSVKISPSSINFYSYLILSIFCLPFIKKYINLSSYTIEYYIYVFIAGLLCAMGTLFLVKAVNIGELSVIGPINSYKSIIGLISAIILLKEIPTVIDIAGIVLIIFGSYFIFETTEEGFSLSILRRKDIQYRLSALILTGIEAGILKKIITLSSIEECLIFWCLTGLFWSYFIVLISKKSFKIKNRNEYLNLIIISICLGLMQYSTNYLFNKMAVGPALALFQLSSVITVFLGFKMFNESNIIKKLFGTIIMITGSALIILN